jgi:Mn2+/Fe2+ NRAMP family transporter
MKRTDIILTVGTLALAFFAGVALTATGTLEGFLSWAWERHHNVLSWYIRPLFILPLVYFSYRRSLPGIVLTLVALATSMFWLLPPSRRTRRSRSSWHSSGSGSLVGGRSPRYS